MNIYARFAKDASDSLFNSIYDDLYALADNDNAARYARPNGSATIAPASIRMHSMTSVMGA